MGIDRAFPAASAASDRMTIATPPDGQPNSVATRKGSHWGDMQERYGYRTLYSRIRRWIQQGIWEQVFDALIELGSSLSALRMDCWHKLLVISEMQRQQSILFHAKSRSMHEQILSMVQRHVRPIICGKASAAVAFGAKISVSVRSGFAFLRRII